MRKGMFFWFACPECAHEVQASYRPATPDVYYLSNGDPGYPGDPDEVECKHETCPECGRIIQEEELLEQGRTKLEPYDHH